MKKASILVVDDETNILDSLRGIFSDEGYTVFTAENGDDALDLMQEKRFDLIFLDVWLPGRRDGLQTLREIRKRNIDTRVIMISGHGTIDTAVRATKLGAYDFIEKPLSLNTVLGAVESALAKENNGGGDREAGYYKYIGDCPAMLEVKEGIERSASSAGPVLISGEMGTGKEYTAAFIHSRSPRKNDPFIKVDCGRLTTVAFEGLFGPADENPAGRSSRFSRLGGTVFLENPELLEKGLQDRLVRLIRVGKEKKGGGRLVFIAAVTASLGRKKGSPLIKELKETLEGEAIVLPPLRERGDDIKTLINYFFEHAAEDFGKADLHLSEEAMNRMVAYPWPGNVKELKSLADNTVMACTSDQIDVDDIAFSGSLSVRQHPAMVVAGGAKSFSSGEKKASVTQKTLKQSIVITGLGLHSGLKTGLILSPLPVNSGIIFGEISSGRQVMALLDNVDTTEYATSLRMGAVSVKTIEHIMATLHMYGVTNAFIKVGDEVPIMDGSAAEFCEMLDNAGVVDQGEAIEPIVINSAITIGDPGGDGKFIMIEPSPSFGVEYRINYPQPVGKMVSVFEAAGVKSYRTEIAPARTFGFVNQIRELEKMGKKGFAEGGKLSNVILIDDEKVINTTLRFEDEFARHKILDILGDMYLLGRPIVGKITASMTGHTENIQLLKKIRSTFTGRQDV